jgi:hypothetical protein
MYFWNKIAEERITQAMQEGEFDNLPGQGKPLKLEDETVGEEFRLAYKILRNAGYVAPEVELMQQINHAHDILHAAGDELARYKAVQRLNYLQMKLQFLRPRSSLLLAEKRYADRLAEKLTR